MRFSFPSFMYFQTSFLIGQAIRSMTNRMNGAASCAQNASLITTPRKT